MYVLAHEELTKTLVDLAEHKTKTITVKVAVDYKMMFCSGSTVKGFLVANLTIEISINFSHHALVSADIVTIHDNQCTLDPLVVDFAKVSNCKRYRRVCKDEISITTSCQEHIKRAQLTGEVPKVCVAVEPEVNIRAIEPIEFA